MLTWWVAQGTAGAVLASVGCTSGLAVTGWTLAHGGRERALAATRVALAAAVGLAVLQVVAFGRR